MLKKISNDKLTLRVIIWEQDLGNGKRKEECAGNG